MIQIFNSKAPLAIKLMLVVLMILAFALALADEGMQMSESNH
jgi:hypothetical protein